MAQTVKKAGAESTFEAGVKMKVRTPFSDLASKSKSWLKTGLSILLYSLGKTNSISSS
jgi:hypothetical protein